MLKLTETYKDFNGLERTEDFYFNLTPAEALEIEMGEVGGFVEMVQAIANAKDAPRIVSIFKKFVLAAYGEKSADGVYFMKSDEIRKKFECHAVYSQIYMRLATDDKKAAEFINQVIEKSEPVTNNVSS